MTKFNFRANKMRQLAIERRDKDAILKKKWTNSGEADSALDQLHGRYKREIKESELPF